MKSDKQRGVTISLWVIAAVLAIRFAWFVLEETSNQATGLGGYYALAVMWLEGEPALHFYDDNRYSAFVERFEPGVYQTFFVNAPTMPLPFLPLALLPYPQARTLWTVANGVAFILILWWLARQLRFSGAWLPGVFIAGLLYHPAYVTIGLGQIYILLLGLELLVWHGYRQGQDRLGGTSLGLMLIFKLAGLLLWPLFLLQRRWRIMVWGGGTAVLIFLLSLPRLGVIAWQQFAVNFLQSSNKPILMVVAYQTWGSFSKRLFIPDAQWNPSPLFDYPAVGEGLSVLGLVVLTAVTLFAAYQSTRRLVGAGEDTAVNDLLFALFLTLGMMINPATVDYHYPLLILPLAIVAARTREQGQPLMWLMLLAAFVLVSTDLPYRSPRLADGAWTLLAYPKLAGSLLLWALTLWQLQTRNSP